MRNDALCARDAYLHKALLFRDSDLVKVVTGIRRCGKSSLLKLVRDRIESEGVQDRGFIAVNLEERGLGIRNADDLYAYLRAHMSPAGRTYVFLDEVQRIEGWHDVVNSVRVEFDCDLYVTGSNAYLLSGELTTYLSGRYVEVKMLPLAFAEYASFCGVAFPEGRTAAIDPKGEVVLFDDLFKRYLLYGGMPALAALETTQEQHAQYLEGLYSTVLVRDVLHRERGREQAIVDPDLLRDLSEYFADTVGRQVSLNKVTAALDASGRKTTNKTVSAYVRAIEDAFMLYPCKRFDIHGRSLLKTLPKYYLVDTGLRHYLTGYRGRDIGFVFENAVYLELLYQGWAPHVGKLGSAEVDYIAVKDGRTVYVQVTDEMSAEATRERELKPLRSIRDNHEKIVVVRRGESEVTGDGIHIVNARDFFLGEGL